MTENWVLFLDTRHAAQPWPWLGHTFAELEAEHLTDLPDSVTDFLRYSPTDGPIDMVHVPREMPREVPVAETRMSLCHTPTHFVFIQAPHPDNPIAELADNTREDFSIVIPATDGTRGLYFGLNQDGEHIACVQVWDPSLQPPDLDQLWPCSLIKHHNATSPHGGTIAVLDHGITTRCVPTTTGLVGCFQISRSLISGAMDGPHLPISIGRRCYATGELLSWGSPLLWTPRPDRHGLVTLADDASLPLLPKLRRIDLAYTPGSEEGQITPSWHPAQIPEFSASASGPYANYAGKVTIALNGLEKTTELDAGTPATFAIPDGWNQLEVLTTFHPPHALSFQKKSGHRLRCRPDSGDLPSQEELLNAFRRWHEHHQVHYLEDGVWGKKDVKVHCLCHDGVFHVEPYIEACVWLGWDPHWEQLIWDMGEHMLAAQRPEGWFPCYCSATNRDTEPELGDGGAFTNGSVGEALGLAGRLLGEDRYTEASRRAADYAWYRWEENQNYAAFALWHLVVLCEIDGLEPWLDKALYLARNFVTRDIGLCGAQGGHNFFTGYGNITLKGMARLLSVLPADHAFYPRLKDLVIRFTNQTLARQQPDGLFAGRNRKYLGYTHLAPGLFFVADALPGAAETLRPALAAMTRAAANMLLGNPDTGLTLALAARYLDRLETA